jgi:hypothetical protein
VVKKGWILGSSLQAEAFRLKPETDGYVKEPDCFVASLLAMTIS